MNARFVGVGAAAGVAAAALWWRAHPSACPYGQRFWVEAPHPFITRERLREALAPQAGERILEVGPGTGYYTLSVAAGSSPVAHPLKGLQIGPERCWQQQPGDVRGLEPHPDADGTRLLVRRA